MENNPTLKTDSIYKATAHYSYLDKDYGTHWHNFYEFEVTLSGNGTQTINGTDYPTRRGEAHIIRPTDTHSITVDEPICLYLIQFGQKHLSNEAYFKIANADFDLITYLDANECTIFESVCRAINTIKSTESNENIAEERIFGLFDVLLSIILQKLDGDSSPHEKALVQSTQIQNIIGYIHAHCLEPITVADIAGQFYYNVTYFSRYFKSGTGVSPSRYLKILRLEQARNLLITTNMRVQDIYAACGYISNATFVRDFKKRYKRTPSEFRTLFHGKV